MTDQLCDGCGAVTPSVRSNNSNKCWNCSKPMSDQTPTNNTDELDEIFDILNGSGEHACYCARSTDGGCKCALKDEYLEEAKQTVHRYAQKIVLAELRAIDPKADYLIKDQVVSVADRITTIEKEMGES